MKKTIGLVMIVKDEEKNLEKCLSCACRLVDRIFVTDTGSTDRTVEIAEKFGAKVSHFAWTNDFAAARNYALDQSDCDWNLVLDADEFLAAGEREELDRFILKECIGGIEINNYFEDPQGEIGVERSFIRRLLPRGVRYKGKIHEQVDSSLPAFRTSIVVDHEGYLHTNKGERNLPILQEQLQDFPEDPYLLYQTARTMYVMKNYADALPYFEKFYQRVSESAAYREDGVTAYLQDLMELAEYERGLEIIQNERERMAAYVDYHFVCGNFYMKMILSDVQRYIAYLPEIELSYIRCLEMGEERDRDGEIGCGSFKAAYNLGVWYEVSGQTDRAVRLYREAAAMGYDPAAQRLKLLCNE